MIHARMTAMKTRAFSRVNASPPIASPRAIQVLRVDAPVVTFDTSHRPRQTKNMSSTDFWSRPSKKMAGAYSASANPAMVPTGFEKNRAPAKANKAHEAEPIRAWQIRRMRRSWPKTA